MDFPHGNLGFLWISMFDDRMGLASNLRWFFDLPSFCQVVFKVVFGRPKHRALLYRLYWAYWGDHVAGLVEWS